MSLFKLWHFEIVSLFKMAQNHSCMTKLQKKGTLTPHIMGTFTSILSLVTQNPVIYKHLKYKGQNLNKFLCLSEHENGSFWWVITFDPLNQIC